MRTTMNAPGEARNFIFYLVGTLLFTLPVAELIFTMWQTGGYQLALARANLPLISSGGESLQAILMFGFGLYFAWLLLYANDWRKRYQGYILIIGTISLLALLSVFGIGILTDNFNLSNPINIASLFIGTILAVTTEIRAGEGKLGGGDLLRIDYSHKKSGWAHWLTTETGRDRPAEFPIAYRGIILLIIGVLAGANVINLQYNQNVSQVSFHFISSLGLMYFLYSLMDINIGSKKDGDNKQESDGSIQFDKGEQSSDVRLEVLGPQQAGKTYLALGMHLVLTQDNEYQIQRIGGRMPDIIEQHSKRVAGKMSGLVGWGIGNTMIDVAQKVSIKFTKTDRSRGEYINSAVSMLDYPGEVLEDVAEEFENQTERKMTDGGEQDEDQNTGYSEEEEDTIKQMLGNLHKDEWDGQEQSTSTTDVNADEGETDTNHQQEDEDGTLPSLAESVADPGSTEKDETAQSDDAETDPDESGADTNPNTDMEDDAETGPDDSINTNPDVHTTANEEAEDTETTGPQEAEDEVAPEMRGNSDMEGPGASSASTDVSHSEREKVKDALIENIGTADKLVVLLDTQRFVTGDDIIMNDPGMMIKEMTKIAQGAGPDEIVPVATKADYLLDEYEELNAETAPGNSEYAQFRQFVNERFQRSHPLANTLIELSDHSVLPVYFLTERVNDSEYKLKIKDGQIQPVGYDDLIDVVIGR